MRAFLLIAEHGSLKGASEELGFTTAWLSRSLRELEVRLGHRLISRRGNRLFGLTEAGEQLKAAIEEPYQRIERAFLELSSKPASLTREASAKHTQILQ